MDERGGGMSGEIYTNGKITLIHGDCMDYMRGLPDKAFDLAIVDPPYFEGPNKPGFYRNGGCRS